MNAKQTIMFIGLAFVLIGLFGFVSFSEPSVTQQTQSSNGQSTIEVKKGNNLPTSTIDYLQGSGNVQGQGRQPQSLNAGSQLQPNAGADSLPDNY